MTAFAVFAHNYINQRICILQSKPVVSSPAVGYPEGYFVRVVDTGKNIGITSIREGGMPTSRIMIYTDRAGNLMTTYPVK